MPPAAQTQLTPYTGDRINGARRRRVAPPALDNAADWYKDAIIYELHVRAFQDSDGDGIGDFPGLIARLDYLQDLGVTAVWLLPFYPSPLRDDGYDIADYGRIHPDYGMMRDFRTFVDEAHKRGIRVITELVLNHTSDQHAWFQRARRAPRGHPHREFYVWSDDPTRYPEVRIIFQDFETSNWTFDPVAGQYYWHRFYHHQPDLNFDNPLVHQALKDVVDFWLGTGVDGLRLDAVPYLYERDGTNCENLPETHAFLRTLRAHVDKRFPGRMLLAEANQWPEDAIAYFGAGDECHMAFHFPLMPRLFMAVRMEDRFPVIDILDQTPPIPESCQWAIFLRNHDELTLEMVTDEERDYMYRTYAHDRRMRINLGIRRRLAPLLGNNRRKVELMNALLFSLPGTPVLYYGDEIGMGDNVYLGDRDSVRTPMQWSGDRNAGFSKANPHKLYLPVIADPAYHFESVNVETQLLQPSSLLWWMKRLIALRKRHPALTSGDLEFLPSDNAKVLAFVRRTEHEHILIVANLSRFVQPVELDLSAYAGRTPIEVYGQTSFPPVGGSPYFLTLAPHSFYWFQFAPDEATSVEHADELPLLETAADPERWITGPGVRRWIEHSFAKALPRKRWFSGKSKVIRAVSAIDLIPLPVEAEGVIGSVIAIIRVEYAADDDEVYQAPLTLAEPAHVLQFVGDQSPALLARVRFRNRSAPLILYDGAVDTHVWVALRKLAASKRKIRTPFGQAVGAALNGKRPRPSSDESSPENLIRILGAEQSNSSAAFGDQSIMKLYRRLEIGVNPDLEISRRLTESARFENTPRMQGSIEYEPSSGVGMTLAMMQEFVPNEGDLWEYTVESVAHFYERTLALPEFKCEIVRTPASLLTHARQAPADAEIQLLDGHLDTAELLGERTAQMHTALATVDEPDFRPEPFTRLYQRSLYQSMRNTVQRPLQSLQSRLLKMDHPVQELAEQVVRRRPEILGQIARVKESPIDAARIRCHGDFHLGQVLWTGRDVIIIDFEGEPMRPLGERRIKRSALSDVAGMLRSFSYATHAGLRKLTERGIAEPTDADQFRQCADFWRHSAESAFLRGYLRAVDPKLIPSTDAGLRALLEAWLLEKAVYEIGYELNNRPDWIEIPLRGVIELLNTSP